MTTRGLIIRGALAILVLVTLASTFYTVSEQEQVVITQFGEPIGQAISTPGLHVKVPFTQDVNVFDKRWLEWNGNPNQVPTRDKKYIWVETYARWRIANPLLFFQRLRDERGAQSRLDDIIDGETRNVIASHNLIEIVRVSNRAFEAAEEAEDVMEAETMRQVELGRDKITRLILERASQVMPDYGIELVDVQIQRINYIETVQAKVFDRMISGAQAHRRPLPLGRSGEERRDPRQEGARAQGDRVRGLQEDPGGDGRRRREGDRHLRRGLQPRSRALQVPAHDGDLQDHHRQAELADAVDRRRRLPLPAVGKRGRARPARGEALMAAATDWDPYGVLNVARTATPEQIRAAYLRQAARYHPDQHHGNPLEELASARMAEINRAYELLSDRPRRAAFDAGARTKTARAAAERGMSGRFMKGAALLLAVPLVFRTGAVIVRVLAALFRLLFEALASLRGPRLAAVAGLTALVVLLFATFRRTRR